MIINKTLIKSSSLAAYSLEVEKITGTTPPAVPCPNSLCKGRADGNYEYYYYSRYNPHYFLQCSNGLAYCQACWPLSLEFSEPCNQCLYNRKDECVSTQPWGTSNHLRMPRQMPPPWTQIQWKHCWPKQLPPIRRLLPRCHCWMYRLPQRITIQREMERLFVQRTL